MKKRKIPTVSTEMELTFQHLYDDNFGVIASEKTHGNDALVMIMPRAGFIPRLNTSYVCHISGTRFGRFIYNSRSYKLYIASRKDEGTILDEIEHSISNIQGEKGFKNNPFDKLKSLTINK